LDQVDTELTSLVLETKTLHRFTDTPLFPGIINKLLANQDVKSTKMAVAQLRNNGFEAEAGCIVLKTRQIHPSFLSIDNALEILNFKFR